MWSKIREPLLFFIGAGGFIHELLSTGERQTLLIACLTMMGLGVVAEADKRRSK